jgi:uncharacterized protein HemY
MDLYRVIFELMQERNRVQKLIESLESAGLEGSGQLRSAGRRRGRKSMDEAARQQVSERMKRYWAERRAKREGQPGLQDATV